MVWPLEVTAGGRVPCWQAWQLCAAACVWLCVGPGRGWREGGQGLDLILKVTGSGKNFNRKWELVRSGILEAALWPCVRVGAGGLPGGGGGSWPFRARPCFPLSLLEEGSPLLAPP